MNDQFKFSETRNTIEQSSLTPREVVTLNNLGLTVEDLNKLLAGPTMAEGSYALVYELPETNSNVIAKAWKNPSTDSHRAEHENAALRLLRMRHSGEAPRLEGYLETPTVLFEEKIDGHPIENFDQNTIPQLAESLAKIHSIELNAFGKPLTQRVHGTKIDCLNSEIEKSKNKLALTPGNSETLLLISQALEKISEKAKNKTDSFQDGDFTLIHFDLNRNNILQDNNSNKIILIDWEQASAGDNAMDIAKLFLKLNFDDEQKKIFLSSYTDSLTKKDEHLTERLESYEPFVLINSILWRLSVLNNTPLESASKNEKDFYERVRANLNVEVDTLKKYLDNVN